MKHLDINQIKEIIPHRHPFLLDGSIEDYEPGDLPWVINVSATGRTFLQVIFPRSR